MISKLDLKIPIFIGFFESILFLAYFIFIMISSLLTSNVERLDTLIIELLIYLTFSIVIFYISKLLIKVNKKAYTPFLLIQLFIVIIAWPLLNENNFLIQIFAILLFIFALTSIFITLLPQNRLRFFK